MFSAAIKLILVPSQILRQLVWRGGKIRCVPLEPASGENVPEVAQAHPDVFHVETGQTPRNGRSIAPHDVFVPFDVKGIDP